MNENWSIEILGQLISGSSRKFRYESYKNMRSTKYKPHHGPKEAARRLRQIERGILKL